MGKRSDFKRNPRDFYPTPKRAVLPLLSHLPADFSFYEPCCGTLDLVIHLDPQKCIGYSDIEANNFNPFVHDALELTEGMVTGATHIVTNPPWDRKILHPMIDHFRNLRPTWLLIDADWAHTKQSRPYLKFCEKIVSVGRVKWIPDSKMTGKDNCAWYLFQKDPVQTKFYNL